MNRILGAVIVMSAVVVGCGGGSSGGPLDATWVTTVSTSGQTVELAIALAAGGTLTETISDAASCSGALTFSGQQWTSTATTITITGTATCSGALSCSGKAVSCSDLGSSTLSAGTATYVLTNDNDTLTITTSGGQAAFVRQ
jgi:hypothetical protein